MPIAWQRLSELTLRLLKPSQTIDACMYRRTVQANDVAPPPTVHIRLMGTEHYPNLSSIHLAV